MARSDPFVEILASVPLFSACSKKELQLVAKSASRVTIPQGTAVVTEGAAGTEFFVILDGRAQIVRHGRQVATLGPGGFFGDLALLDRAPRNATVVADTELEVAKLGQRGFDALLDTPGFSKKLLAARRLREQDARNL